MEVQHFMPNGVSGKLVVRYEIIKNEKAEHIVDKHIPSGYAAFVFNFMSNVNIKGNPPLPPCILVTPFLEAICVETEQRLDTFVVLCKASVLSKLFKICLYPRERKNFIVLDSEVFMNLWYQLKDLTTPSERIAQFELFLQTNIAIDGYQTDNIDCIYEHILKDLGKTPISKLTESHQIRPRTFRRNFTKRVGINAKTLSRIVRVNYLWENIMNHKAVDFQDLVFSCDYCDQSHFIKDFKKITGESPSFFFKRNLELVKIISGKN